MSRHGIVADPVDEMLNVDARIDHEQAVRRGQRIYLVADAAVADLIGRGLLQTASADDARVALFTIIADDVYGNAAIDVPPLRKGGAA